MRPRWAVTAIALLLGVNLAYSLAELAENNNDWDNIEAVARKVKQVTPDNAPVLADPPVYFAMRQIPPMGSNFPASHRLELPAAEAARLHIVPQSQLQIQVGAGDFATVETCEEDEDEIQALNLARFYSEKATFGDCAVYWGFVGSH
jgi:hypothetical protein